MPAAREHDDAAIREQAYYLWEQDGRPDGREAEHWTRAELSLEKVKVPKAPSADKAVASKSKPKASKQAAADKKKPKAK